MSDAAWRARLTQLATHAGCAHAPTCCVDHLVLPRWCAACVALLRAMPLAPEPTPPTRWGACPDSAPASSASASSAHS